MQDVLREQNTRMICFLIIVDMFYPYYNMMFHRDAIRSLANPN